MHQEESVNKCLPPSTFKSPPPPPVHRPPTPALQKATASHVTHYQGGRKHVFGIKLLRALSNKIHFLIGSFHNIYILPFFFFCFCPGKWVLLVFLSVKQRCPMEVKFMRSSPGGESRWGRTTLGEKERPCRHMKQNKQSDF